MDEFETEVRNRIAEWIHGAAASGVIRCDMSEGHSGFTGSIVKSADPLCEIQATEIDEREDDWRLTTQLLDLYEASKAEPLGPCYHVNIKIQPTGAVTFDYFWRKTPFRSVKELEPTLHGRVPSFAFEDRFDAEMIRELTDFDLETALGVYVANQLSRKRVVSESLMEMYAIAEWQCDVDNGGMNQYLGRDYDPSAGLPRESFYPQVLYGLRRIGHTEAAALFAESLAIYAHFHPRVEAVRESLQVPARPFSEYSDVMDRYWELDRSIEKVRVAYIREHADEWPKQP